MKAGGSAGLAGDCPPRLHGGAEDEEGPRRGIERAGIRAADLIIAISELSY
jgi:hypothetical protein